MGKIHWNDLLVDVKFELYDRNETGEIIKVFYEGTKQLVNYRYKLWSTVVSPIKLLVVTREGNKL